MAQDVIVEDRRDRMDLAHDAGFGRLSLFGILAGTLVAFGAFAVLAALAAAIIGALGMDTNFSTNEWRQAGFVAAAVMAVVQFVSYFFGGYVAGRMARRSGAMNGVMVFIVGLLIALGVAALANAFANTDEVARNLRSVGVPTTGEEWRDVGIIAAVATLLAMLAGAILGGIKGERWHGKLVGRAWDSDVGPGVPAAPPARDVRDRDREVTDEDETRDARVVDDGESVMTSRRDTLGRDTTLDEDYDPDRREDREHEPASRGHDRD